MQITTFSTPTSTTATDYEFQALKVAYLLSDKIQVAGEMNSNLYFEKNYKNFMVKKKVQFMIDFFRKSKLEDMDICINSLNEFLKTYNAMQLIKHPSNAVFIAYKKELIQYESFFKSFVECKIKQLSNWKVKDFITLLDQNFFVSALPEFTTGEMKTGKKFANANADNILALLFPEDSDINPNILLLPYEFYFDEIQDFIDIGQEDGSFCKLKVDDTDFCCYQMLTIKSFQNFSSFQMKLIKSELDVCGNTFRQKMDNWLRFCNRNFNLSDQISNLRSDFGIWNHQFQKLIKNNHTLNNQFQLDELSMYESVVNIGVVPLNLIWQYFGNSNVVDEDTISALKEKTTNSNKYPINIPAMCITPNFKYSDKLQELKKDEDDNATSPTRKKFLSID